MTTLVAQVPSPGGVALMLIISAALFGGITLLCWSVEAFWNKILGKRNSVGSFPYHEAMSGSAALRFTAIHTPWIVLLTAGLGGVLSLTLDALGIKLPQQELVEWLTSPDSPVATKVLITFFAVVLAPIIEEFLFRRFIFRAMLRLSGRLIPSIIFIGILFGVTHAKILVVLPIAVFGALLAWLYYRTGRLWAPMLCHATLNAIEASFALAFPALAAQ